MNNGYEYYYLFGLDIPLEKYKLGTVKQPKIIDFINNRVDIESFYLPFIYLDIAIGQAESKEHILELRNQLGSLKFLLTTCYQASRIDVIHSLLESLSLLYGKEAEIGQELNIIIDDVEINDSNFDILCDLVLEILKIDKEKLKFENKQNAKMSKLEMEFERRKKAYLERNQVKKKDDKFTILDISNAVIHSGIFKYEDVLNMTVYQLKNSYSSINMKESFDISMMYRASPKFDMSKEKYEHWTENIKISKSRLAN